MFAFTRLGSHVAPSLAIPLCQKSEERCAATKTLALQFGGIVTFGSNEELLPVNVRRHSTNVTPSELSKDEEVLSSWDGGVGLLEHDPYL